MAVKLLCFFRGRFGIVYKCVEKASGLTLAAKIIKARSAKEKVSVCALGASISCKII